MFNVQGLCLRIMENIETMVKPPPQTQDLQLPTFVLAGNLMNLFKFTERQY